ncbi:hypothetical protein LHYA1_G003078 [Lachnellula hyalina]|uniref:Uncharacterized protein n=1 Tax=Lachnellula hyalina TaxID=1316788 RepID=A0A8H8U101_9HELO|nr:uncharacterized protein LHYA1_G003078 [Lachnellula hyalina]TVY27865.1 hypothetical protein LHYA1_G003078 [Lachnellula hyalina]
MRIPILPTALALACYAHLTCALLTLQTMRNLTVITDECREHIVDGSETLGEVDEMARALMGDQRLLRGGNEDEHGMEVEDSRPWHEGAPNLCLIPDFALRFLLIIRFRQTIAASLHLLCSFLLAELEKPLDLTLEPPEQNCTVTTTQYHAFLYSTANFLLPIQERQMKYRWTSQSAVFENLGWFQALWASRKTNSQDRSFIEQQIELYKEGSCFEKNEVLRRGVEVVEWLNDLIDMFA